MNERYEYGAGILRYTCKTWLLEFQLNSGVHASMSITPPLWAVEGATYACCITAKASEDFISKPSILTHFTI